MTDQPDLKARVEKRAPVQGYTPGIPWEMHLRAYDAYCKRYSPQPALIDLEGRNCRGGFGTEELDLFIPSWREELSERTALLSRITDLEAERDDVLKFAGCDSLSQLASAYSTAQANWDLTLDRAQAAESRLALAEKVVEAGRVAEQALSEVNHAYWSGERWYSRGETGLREQVRKWLDKAQGPLSAALTAFAENTSSNDLTTGEDDA